MAEGQRPGSVGWRASRAHLANRLARLHVHDVVPVHAPRPEPGRRVFDDDRLAVLEEVAQQVLRVLLGVRVAPEPAYREGEDDLR